MTCRPRRSRTLQLARTVFFKKVADGVFVRNVATGEEFLFTPDAAPVFSALRRGSAPDRPALRGRSAFIRLLKTHGLLQSAETGRRSRAKTVVPPRAPGEGAVRDIAGRCQDACLRTNRLWSAGLELTWRCNARCRHCYLDVPEEQTAAGELTEAQWLFVVDQLARMGCMNVLVTGGEPTLHPAFLAVCKRIADRGMLCDVYTNGIAVSDAMFDALRAIPLNSVSFSLYSGAAAFHDEITGVPGSFRRTLSTLLRFKEADVRVYAKAPMFHGHLEDVFSAMELGEKTGFPVKPANILVPGHSGTGRNPMMLRPSEYEAFLERNSTPDPFAGAEQAREVRANGPVCQAGRTTLCVSPTGNVTPCNSFPRVCGNVLEMPLAAIWRKSAPLRRLRALRFKDFSPRCATCADIAFCTICPGASWIETNGSFAPCSWSCEQTAVRAAFNRNQKTKNT